MLKYRRIQAQLEEKDSPLQKELYSPEYGLKHTRCILLQPGSIQPRGMDVLDALEAGREAVQIAGARELITGLN